MKNDDSEDKENKRMSNSEIIQKGMRVLQIRSKIIMFFAYVSVALTSIVVSVISLGITDVIYESINRPAWNSFDDVGGITPGIFLILLAMVIRYGTELNSFPLFCPKCMQEGLIDAKHLQIIVIKGLEVKTQSGSTNRPTGV